MPSISLTPAQFQQRFSDFVPQVVDLEKMIFETGANRLDAIGGVLQSVGLPHHAVDGAGIVADLGSSHKASQGVAVRVVAHSPHHGAQHDDFRLASVVGLGLLLFLQQIGELPRPLRVLFESQNSDARTSVRHLIENGGLSGVSEIVGLDCNPAVPVGQVGLKSGAILPSSAHFEMTLSRNSKEVVRTSSADLIQAAAHVMISLNQMLTRRVDPLQPARLAYTSISGSSSTGSEPDLIAISGLIHAADEEAVARISSLLEDELHALTGAFEAVFQFNLGPHNQMVCNDADCARRVQHACQEAMGKNNVIGLEFLNKDFAGFAEYLRHVPAAILHISSHENLRRGQPSAADAEQWLDRVVQTGIKCLSRFVCNYAGV